MLSRRSLQPRLFQCACDPLPVAVDGIAGALKHIRLETEPRFDHVLQSESESYRYCIKNALNFFKYLENTLIRKRPNEFFKFLSSTGEKCSSRMKNKSYMIAISTSVYYKEHKNSQLS